VPLVSQFCEVYDHFFFKMERCLKKIRAKNKKDQAVSSRSLKNKRKRILCRKIHDDLHLFLTFLWLPLYFNPYMSRKREG
ncbi:MAG: hypothetical protein DME76_18925, partial [Verrucomicrobia bacterium]